MQKGPTPEELRASVKVIDLIRYYGYDSEFREVGAGKWRGPCFIHGGDNLQSLKIDETEHWRCFSCRRKGSVIDLVAAYENIPFPKAMIRLNQIRQKLDLKLTSDAPPERNKKAFKPISRMPISVQAPFYLLDRDRGLIDKTIKYFGVRMSAARWGMMQRRILIPIHNSYGRLISYGARKVLWCKTCKYTGFDFKDRETGENVCPACGSKAIAGDIGPKYWVPNDLPTWTMFYNEHRALPPEGKREVIIVTEGYFDVLKLHQAGYDNAISAFGAFLTSQQAAIIDQRAERVILMYDGDDAGEHATVSAARLLKIPVSKVLLPPQTDPGDLTEEEIHHFLGDI